MYADLQGIESHGVSNMMRVYVHDLKRGDINPNPKERIAADAGGAVTVDGDRGLGLVVGPRAMNLAIDGAGELVYIAPTRVNLQLAQERWPQVRFANTREHAASVEV